ncbi:MAG: homoserine dehydrogenase [Hyphomicrobiales bacterium]
MSGPLKIGIAGLGTVGSGVLDALAANADLIAKRAGRRIEVVGVSARDRSKKRSQDLAGLAWIDTPEALAANPEVDIFVELIGGGGNPAKSAVEAALSAGKSVVTANKALLARHGSALARLAEERGAGLSFEAAVAGGIPIVKTMREALVGNRIRKVFGILNGTCNFILTKMAEEGRDFADVLKEAQALGYAEADPTFDVGGFDTAHKLAILTSLAFGTKVDVDSIDIEGIEAITLDDLRNAGEMGYKLKLLGVAVASEEGIEQRVHPTLVPKHSPVADTDGVFNAVVVRGDFAGDLMLEGRGAGGHPTASAIISDIVDIACGNRRPCFGIPARDLAPFKRAPTKAHEGGFYVALELYDRPGAVAAIASALATARISIESIVQRAPARGGSTARFTLITHDTLLSSMRAALAAIEKDGHVAARPRMIRIERL